MRPGLAGGWSGPEKGHASAEFLEADDTDEVHSETPPSAVPWLVKRKELRVKGLFCLVENVVNPQASNFHSVWQFCPGMVSVPI